MKPKVGKNLIVEWFDAMSMDEWTDVADAKIGLALIVTVGRCIEINKKNITIALNYDTTNEKVSCFIAIHRQWIDDIRELKDAKTKTVPANSQKRIVRK